MHRSIDGIRGRAIMARDGEIGTVADLLLDDSSWRIRYLVAETGEWLSGRQVLLVPDAVSRQFEADLYRRYGYAPYWAEGSALTPFAAPGSALIEERVHGPREPTDPGRDPHLRSTHEITGYHVEARDDEVGHVEDLVLDDDWRIPLVVVDTRNIRRGRKVLVGVDAIEAVSFHDRRLRVALRREEIESRPAVDG